MKQAWSALTGLITFALWLISVALVLLSILILRDAIVLLYAWLAPEAVNPDVQYGQRYWLGLSIGNFATLFLAVLGVVFAIGTGEYHSKHWGTYRSWKLFAWSFGAEALILVLGWFT
ncbi:MAG: hypothetical protein AAF702_27285 [Chloroflexota bacterium]